MLGWSKELRWALFLEITPPPSPVLALVRPFYSKNGFVTQIISKTGKKDLQTLLLDLISLAPSISRTHFPLCMTFPMIWSRGIPPSTIPPFFKNCFIGTGACICDWWMIGASWVTSLIGTVVRIRSFAMARLHNWWRQEITRERQNQNLLSFSMIGWMTWWTWWWIVSFTTVPLSMIVRSFSAWN